MLGDRSGIIRNCELGVRNDRGLGRGFESSFKMERYMTQKERMNAGLLYRGFDEELTKERQRAKRLLHEYNNVIDPDDGEKREELLRSLLGGMGNDVWLEPPFRCDYGSNIELGHGVYSNYNLTVLDCAKVTIGNHVLIGPNVGIYTAGHAIDPALRKAGWEFAQPITIEENVWIGAGVSICPGVTIGENSVIGAGSVVTKEIPSNVIAVGNPCRVLRAITDEDKKYYFKDKEIDV